MKKHHAVLDKEHKLRLVELMIIVGGLLSAFKVSGIGIIYYIIFLLLAMIYFVGLIGGVFTHQKIIFHFNAIFLSLSFSIFVGEILRQTLLVSYNLVFSLIVALCYILVFSFLFYRALTNE